MMTLNHDFDYATRTLSFSSDLHSSINKMSYLGRISESALFLPQALCPSLTINFAGSSLQTPFLLFILYSILAVCLFVVLVISSMLE